MFLHFVLQEWNDDLGPADCDEDGLGRCLRFEVGHLKCNFSICGLNLAVIHVADGG